jgi:hypothetical protein
MSQLPRHLPLSDADEQRLEQLSAKFAESWKRCPPDLGISLAAYLPGLDDRLRLASLHKLIPIDLEYRWKRRERVVIENYLKDYPELGSTDALPVELILAEYHVRSQHGDTLPGETYSRRFPRQYPELQRMVDTRPRGTLVTQSTPPAANPLAGSRKILPVGEGYQLLESIGRGAYGEVWRATAPGGVEVAIKLMKWTSSNSLSQVELRALELMKRLRHPFLMQVQAYWLAEDHLYIVMDLADGNLQQRFDECSRKGLTGIPAEELLGYLREAAEGLDYLHENQVLHRDVKPANILLSGGHARLADFGLARLMMEEGAELGATLIGTPLYMSPEVWGQKVSPSSDQYSLASTYVELRLGRPLFEADSQMEVMKKHLTMRPDLNPLPADEQRVLQRALAKKGAERYKTCVEFVSDLHRAVLGDTRPAKRGPSRRQVMVLGSLACLAGSTVVAGLSWSGFGFKLVAPPPTVLPPHCERAPDATEVVVREEGVKYWNRIVRTLPNKAVLASGMPCVFVLIPYHAEQKLGSFYMMENKVWNELFAEFNRQYLEEHPSLLNSEEWPNDWADRGAERAHGDDMPAASYPRYPVMRVSFRQAQEFAKWLGGSLPSPLQWDVAAGLYSPAAKKSGALGPFRGDWNNSPRPKIAVDVGGAGTSPVGASEDDISPFFCRDMAGNGAEWTSQVSSPPYSMVMLRGRDYHKDQPLLYSELATSSTENEKEDPYLTSDHIGFRVVLEPIASGPPPTGE